MADIIHQSTLTINVQTSNTPSPLPLHCPPSLLRIPSAVSPQGALQASASQHQTSLGRDDAASISQNAASAATHVSCAQLKHGLAPDIQTGNIGMYSSSATLGLLGSALKTSAERCPAPKESATGKVGVLSTLSPSTPKGSSGTTEFAVQLTQWDGGTSPFRIPNQGVGKTGSGGTTRSSASDVLTMSVRSASGCAALDDSSFVTENGPVLFSFPVPVPSGIALSASANTSTCMATAALRSAEIPKTDMASCRHWDVEALNWSDRYETGGERGRILSTILRPSLFSALTYTYHLSWYRNFSIRPNIFSGLMLLLPRSPGTVH